MAKIKKIDRKMYEKLQAERAYTLRQAIDMNSERHGSQDMTDSVYNAYRMFQDKYRKIIDQIAILEVRIEYSKLLKDKEKIEEQIDYFIQVYGGAEETEQEGENADEKYKSSQRYKNLTDQLDRVQKKIENLQRQVNGDIPPVEKIKRAQRERKQIMKDFNIAYKVFDKWRTQIDSQYFKYDTLHSLIDVLDALGVPVMYNPEGMNYLVNSVNMTGILEDSGVSLVNLDIDVKNIEEMFEGYQNYDVNHEHDGKSQMTIEEINGNVLWDMPEQIRLREILLEIESKIKDSEYWINKHDNGWKYRYNQPNSHELRIVPLYRGWNVFVGAIERLLLRRLRKTDATVKQSANMVKKAMKNGDVTKEELETIEAILKEMTEPEKIKGQNGFFQVKILTQLNEKYANYSDKKIRMQNDLRTWVTNWYINNGKDIKQISGDESKNEYINRLVKFMLPFMQTLTETDLENVVISQKEERIDDEEPEESFFEKARVKFRAMMKRVPKIEKKPNNATKKLDVMEVIKTNSNLTDEQKDAIRYYKRAHHEEVSKRETEIYYSPVPKEISDLRIPLNEWPEMLMNFEILRLLPREAKNIVAVNSNLSEEQITYLDEYFQKNPEAILAKKTAAPIWLKPKGEESQITAEQWKEMVAKYEVLKEAEAKVRKIKDIKENYNPQEKSKLEVCKTEREITELKAKIQKQPLPPNWSDVVDTVEQWYDLMLYLELKNELAR